LPDLGGEVKVDPVMSGDDYRRLIHTLHRRYHREWERAELLEQELARVRGSWLGPAAAWLGYLKRWLPRRRRTAAHDFPPGPCRLLSEGPGPVSGRISIVIPFKDRLELLRGCLRSLRASSYRDFEVVLVDNGSVERRTIRYLIHAAEGGVRFDREGESPAEPGGRRAEKARPCSGQALGSAGASPSRVGPRAVKATPPAGSRLRSLRKRGKVVVVHRPGPFNFSRLCNDGAKQAGGDYLLFLNNDTEALTSDWLERMLRLAALPGVGVVGATLLYPDGTIQHAGLFPRGDGKWVHAYRLLPGNSPGGHGELQKPRVVPALSGACLMMRKDLFEELGGFNEELPLTYNDVDLCCRVRRRGLVAAISPHARLLHYECLSRGFAGDEPGVGHLRALDDFPQTPSAAS
jgi:GT2 family glycosyltransferase